MTNLEIQQYIEDNCRDEQGGKMMDEQVFYEGAKWYRDHLVNTLILPVVVNSVIQEIERRRDLIISEPDGIVREQMISNIALEL